MSGKLSRTVLRRGKGSNPFSLVEYTCPTFTNELKRKGIKPSYSKAGCPYDNAVAESFFRTFKQDEVNHNYFKTETDLKDSVDEFMYFYNNIRPHNSLGRLTPSEKEENYFDLIKSH